MESFLSFFESWSAWIFLSPGQILIFFRGGQSQFLNRGQLGIFVKVVNFAF